MITNLTECNFRNGSYKVGYYRTTEAVDKSNNPICELDTVEVYSNIDTNNLEGQIKSKLNECEYAGAIISNFITTETYNEDRDINFDTFISYNKLSRKSE